MNWTEHTGAPQSALSLVSATFLRAVPYARGVGLACLCCVVVGCAVEGAEQELGATAYTRGQPVSGVGPQASQSSIGPAVAVAPGASAPAAGSQPTQTTPTNSAAASSSGVGPAAGNASAAGAQAPAMQPQANDTSVAPVIPGMPGAAGSTAPAAGSGAPATTPDPSASNEPSSSSTEADTTATEGEPTESTAPEEPAGPGMLTVAFKSKGPGGRYAPRNCGAVWIEDESGDFVKTIERWTAIRERYLEHWTSASGGWGFSFFGNTGQNPDQVDVVTAGTLSSHQMHMSTWNMKDVDGEVVPDGKYTVVVEVSEGSSGVGRVEFVKGPMEQMLTGESSVFTDMKVTYSR